MAKLPTIKEMAEEVAKEALKIICTEKPELKEIKGALEKQIPKDVIFVHPLQEDDGGDYMCPNCKRGTVYNAYGDKSLHCPYCGQALKWE